MFSNVILFFIYLKRNKKEKLGPYVIKFPMSVVIYIYNFNVLRVLIDGEDDGGGPYC